MVDVTVFGQIQEQFPAIGAVILLAMAVYFIVRTIALTFGDALGAVGNFFRDRRAITHSEADDMRKRLKYLDDRVEKLLYRDQCYFAYVLADQEYHHRQKLIAIELGWVLEPHVPFLEFRDRWMRDRGLEKELEMWK